MATKLERRGFSRASIHLATGTKLMATGRPFALLGARSDSGRTCFAVARGTSLGPTICHVSEPLLVFTEPDLCAACSPGRSPLKTLTILALVRHDVSSVTMIADGRESGIGISPVDGGNYAFNGGATRNDTVIRARGTGQSILAERRLRLP